MLDRFRLSSKFSIILIAVFIIGLLVSFAALSYLLTKRAEQEVTMRGLVLLESMNSVRNYTSTSINPMLQAQFGTDDYYFVAQGVPGFAVRQVFDDFRQDPDYSAFVYKEAALNPTNRLNLVDDFERDVLNRFRSDGDLSELSGFRTLGGERVFYIARPLSVQSESCLLCHSDPANAPAQFISSYGDQNGFGWQMGETVAAQMIYVPAGEVYGAAQRSVGVTMILFTGIFLAIMLIINKTLRQAVITPVSQIALVAEKVTAGEVVVEELHSESLDTIVNRQDELGQLSRIFRTMTEEVVKREQSLKMQIKQLIIQIDEVKKEQQVKQVVESDYFSDVKAKAEQMRQRSRQQRNNE